MLPAYSVSLDPKRQQKTFAVQDLHFWYLLRSIDIGQFLAAAGEINTKNQQLD